MTAEEYVVEKLKGKDIIIQKLEQHILEMEKELNYAKESLSKIADLIELEETNNYAYYDFTVWKNDSNGIFNMVEEIKRNYGTCRNGDR